MATLQQEQKDVQREIKAHHKTLSRISAAKQQNESSAVKSAGLLEQIAQGESRLVEIRNRLDSLEAESISAAEVEAAFADFHALWNTLSPREQHQLLELLVARVAFDVQQGTIAITFHSAGIKSLATSSQENAA